MENLQGVTITKNSLAGSRNAVGDAYELYLEEGACQECLYKGLDAGGNWWGQGAGPSVETQENQCEYSNDEYGKPTQMNSILSYR